MRVGGGIRDTYNLGRFTSGGMIDSKYFSWEPIEKTVIEGRNRPIFSESLHARVEELRRLGRVLSSHSPGNAKQRRIFQDITNLAMERFATLQLAVDASLRTQVTPEILMKELADDVFGPSTVGYRYFSSFSEPGEVLHWAFVTDAE
jgi:hypothetical protein